MLSSGREHEFTGKLIKIDNAEEGIPPEVQISPLRLILLIIMLLPEFDHQFIRKKKFYFHSSNDFTYGQS